VVGKRELIERVRKDPLARVCRLDRLLVGAVRETLVAYVRGSAFADVPTLRMLALSAAQIGRRAGRVRREVARRSGQGGRLRVVDGVSKTGGGSSPMGERPTRLLAVSGPDGDAGPLEQALRRGTPPIVGRLQEGHLLLDLRTVLPTQDETLTDRLAEEM
jgi:L-seryl-tRNA(Ser) seleniumtransferase